MIVNSEKEVYFDKYCPKCKYKDRKEDEDPCYDCLADTTNTYSHKPTRFEEKD